MLRIYNDKDFEAHVKAKKLVLAIFMDTATQLEVRLSSCDHTHMCI
jgi:hypothetical protein